jgi:hypothetical protein
MNNPSGIPVDKSGPGGEEGKYPVLPRQAHERIARVSGRLVGLQSGIAPEFLVPAVYHAGGRVTRNPLQTLAPNVNGVA